MKKILLTQRLDPVPGRDEKRDSVDFKWGALLWENGFIPIPACNGIKSVKEYLDAVDPQGILISGGNNIGEEPDRDRLELAALDYAEEHLIPVFGVCRGLQIINHRQGGTLVKIENHTAVRHPARGSLLKKEREVNSYHNYGITADTLGKDLTVMAETSDGSVEALKHSDLPWLAVMWHPERENPFDEDDLKIIKEHLGGNR